MHDQVQWALEIQAVHHEQARQIRCEGIFIM